MRYILAYNEEDLTFKGFFVEGIHSDIPSPNLSIDKELWSYLVTLNSFKLKADFIEKDFYTIVDKDLFEEVIIPVEDIPVDPIPTLDERIDSLELENAELLLTSVEQDLRVTSVEQDLADLMMEIAIMREV